MGQIHNFHKHTVLLISSLERVVNHSNPRFESNGWQWSACEICTGTFRVPIQRQGRLPASGFGRMSLLHLHQAASVPERDGVGYSFSLRAESGENQDGLARTLRRVEACRDQREGARGPALCLRTPMSYFLLLLRAPSTVRFAVAISPILPL